MFNRDITSLSANYGKVGEMTVSRGKKHDYLGMTLDFSEDGKCIVDMEEYLDEILSGLPEEMNGVTTIPASDHLFKTRNNAPKLSKTRAVLFHCVTAQLLFVAQRGRPDLRTAISFLTKQVGEDTTDKNEYKHFARVAKYIHRTKFLRLTSEATYLDQNRWFIDAAFSVHDDRRNHTGAYKMFGKGMIDGLAKG